MLFRKMKVSILFEQVLYNFLKSQKNHDDPQNCFTCKGCGQLKLAFYALPIPNKVSIIKW